VREDDSTEIHTLFIHHTLHFETLLRRRVRVNGDGDGGRQVGPRNGSHNSLDARRQSRNVNCAFQESCSYTSAGNAAFDVANKKVDHGVGNFRCEGLVERRSTMMEEERHVLVGVATSRHNDVEFGDLCRHLLHARKVTSETHHCWIDDRLYARGTERRQLFDGVTNAVVLVAPLVGIVLLDVSGQYKDVFVDVGPSEGRRVDGSIDGLNRGHNASERKVVLAGD
jgi:hypothetical protein